MMAENDQFRLESCSKLERSVCTLIPSGSSPPDRCRGVCHELRLRECGEGTTGEKLDADKVFGATNDTDIGNSSSRHATEIRIESFISLDVHVAKNQRSSNKRGVKEMGEWSCFQVARGSTPSARNSSCTSLWSIQYV